MASGYANTSLSGRQFNGEATGSGTVGHASRGGVAAGRATKFDWRSVVMDVRFSFCEFPSNFALQVVDGLVITSICFKYHWKFFNTFPRSRDVVIVYRTVIIVRYSSNLFFGVKKRHSGYDVSMYGDCRMIKEIRVD